MRDRVVYDFCVVKWSFVRLGREEVCDWRAAGLGYRSSLFLLGDPGVVARCLRVLQSQVRVLGLQNLERDVLLFSIDAVQGELAILQMSCVVVVWTSNLEMWWRGGEGNLR